MPDSPPPMTKADFSTLTVCRCSGCNSRDLASAILTRSLDFWVAFSGSCMCTQEHWSRMLAISNR